MARWMRTCTTTATHAAGSPRSSSPRCGGSGTFPSHRSTSPCRCWSSRARRRPRPPRGAAVLRLAAQPQPGRSGAGARRQRRRPQRRHARAVGASPCRGPWRHPAERYGLVVLHGRERERALLAALVDQARGGKRRRAGRAGRAGRRQDRPAARPAWPRSAEPVARARAAHCRRGVRVADAVRGPAPAAAPRRGPGPAAALPRHGRCGSRSASRTGPPSSRSWSGSPCLSVLTDAAEDDLPRAVCGRRRALARLGVRGRLARSRLVSCPRTRWPWSSPPAPARPASPAFAAAGVARARGRRPRRRQRPVQLLDERGGETAARRGRRPTGPRDRGEPARPAGAAHRAQPRPAARGRRRCRSS